MKDRVLAGRYKLDRLLGEGATGRVYLARDTRERGAVWAVKEFDYSQVPLSEVGESRALFAREAELLKTLRHESLPRVVDHFTLDARDYLVMERVEGPTLEGMLVSRGRPLPEDRVWAIGLGLLRALHYLHHRTPPVIYRDMKPANVMVTLSAGVKLIDFGIARIAVAPKAGDTTCYGTPGFAPPEQYQGRTVPASDIYSLGMTMLRAVTLYDPPEFRFEHPQAASLNPVLSDTLSSALELMLRKRPEERPTAADLLPTFEALAARPPSNNLAAVLWRRSQRKLREILRGRRPPDH